MKNKNEMKIKRKIGALAIVGILTLIICIPGIMAITWTDDPYNDSLRIVIDSDDSTPYVDEEAFAVAHDDDKKILFYIQEDGKTGINDDSPDGIFEVNPDGTEDNGDEIVVNTNGRLGIGDTSPDFKLEVTGSSGSGYFGVTSSSDGDIFKIDSSGNVGIGTTDPDGLEITLPVDEHEKQWRDNVRLGVHDGTARIIFEDEGSIWEIDNANGNFRIFTAYGVKLNINFDGNVGIGTTGPDRKLDLLDTSGPQLRLTHTDGSVYTDFQTTSSGNLGINPSGYRVEVVGDIWATGGTSQRRLLLSTTNNKYHLQLEDDAFDGIGFYKALPTPAGWQMVLTTEGNVGIGTTGPIAKAHIVQTANADAFRVDDEGDENSPFIIDKDGKVGIGVASPAEKLEIDGNVIFNTGANRKIYVERPFNLYGEDGYDLTVQAGKACAKQVGYEARPGGDLFLRGGDGDGYPGGGGGRVYIFGGISDASAYSPVVLAHDGTAAAGRVGIGTANPQGALDVVSTTGGFIVPRMTNTQQSSIIAVNGMIIYDTTNNQFEFYENGAWVTGSELT